MRATPTFALEVLLDQWESRQVNFQTGLAGSLYGWFTYGKQAALWCRNVPGKPRFQERVFLGPARYYKGG